MKNDDSQYRVLSPEEIDELRAEMQESAKYMKRRLEEMRQDESARVTKKPPAPGM